MQRQLALLEDADIFPFGLSYHPEFISEVEEADLLKVIDELQFSSFEMHGVEAKRKIVHFGMKYDFLSRKASQIEATPEWLNDLKSRAQRFVDKEIQQALVTYYPEGAGIGWHHDAPAFESLMGISLNSSCRMMLRKGQVRDWEKKELILEQRSLYVMEGEARWKWQHHIPSVKSPRYSITFRTLINA